MKLSSALGVRPRMLSVFLRLRVPSVRKGLVPVAKWSIVYGSVEVALSFGHRTPFGVGLLGAIVPLLFLEAWTGARHRWRVRLSDTLAFFVPLCGLLSFSAMPGSCCFCDHSPGARALRLAQFVGEFSYFNALAALPALLMLVILRRQAPSPVEQKAYVLSTLSAFLAILSTTVTFTGAIYLLEAQFAKLP